MKVTIEKQADGSYIAYNTTGDRVQLLGTGETVSEAKEDFFDSIEEVKECFSEKGEEVPSALTELVDFSFDISSLFEYYSIFNVSALGRYLGINPGLMRQYKKGNTPISDAQLEKIESGIHRLAHELASISLI